MLSDDAVFKREANSLYEAVLRITDSIEIMVRQGTMNCNSKKFEKSVLDTTFSVLPSSVYNRISIFGVGGCLQKMRNYKG